MFEQKKPELVQWENNSDLKQAILDNGLTIEKLDQKSFPSLKRLIQENKNDDGFVQMSDEIISGKKLNAILSSTSKDQCYIARSNQNNLIIGFIVFGRNDDVYCIDSLGVDRVYRQSKNAKEKCIGSTLLLVASNELFTNDKAQQVGVMISDDNSGDFYKKCYFKIDENEDDVMWLSLTKYSMFEKDYLNKSLQPKLAVHLKRAA